MAFICFALDGGAFGFEIVIAVMAGWVFLCTVYRWTDRGWIDLHGGTKFHFHSHACSTSLRVADLRVDPLLLLLFY